jgi:DNA-binding transcriptional LysR family regulator
MQDIPPDLSARQLRAVLAVAEQRSFIAAAAYLKVSQPALTRTIKQVEKVLGVELFSRTTRRVALTPAGREFVGVAARLLNDLSISVASLRKQAGQQVGQIIVSSVLSLAGAVLPELLATFGRRYPGIEVHLREGIQADVVDEVHSGMADFGIGYLEGLTDNLTVEGISTERFHVVMPTSHPLAARKRLEIRDVAQEVFVSLPRESRSRQVTDSAAAAAGCSLRYAMTANRLPTLLELVRNRIGIAIITASECPKPDRQLTSRPLSGARFACRLGVLRSRERELTAAAAIFLVVVQRWLGSVQRGANIRVAKTSAGS